MFIAKVWFFIPELLGPLFSNLILGAFFYLVLWPLAMVMRMQRADPLQLRLPIQKQSNWVSRDHEYQPNDLKNPW